jgi:hypothetical protein
MVYDHRCLLELTSFDHGLATDGAYPLAVAPHTFEVFTAKAVGLDPPVFPTESGYVIVDVFTIFTHTHSIPQKQGVVKPKRI